VGTALAIKYECNPELSIIHSFTRFYLLETLIIFAESCTKTAMIPNRKSTNPFFDPDYLEEYERTEEESLEELALEMTRTGNLQILGSFSTGITGHRPRNPLVSAEFVEAHGVVDQDRLDQEAREITRDAQLRVSGAMRPLSITVVSRVNMSDYSKPLEISHRTELHLSRHHLDWDANRKWSCSFCGTDMKEHFWSSFDINSEGDNAPRVRPAHCTLHLLFHRISQDFFPGTRVVLDTNQSHLNNPRFIKLVFNQVDEQSIVMSTTWIDMLFEPPRERDGPSSRPMKIDMQLQRVAAYSRNCARTHKLCRTDTSPIPAKRVLDLTSYSTGVVRLIETSGIIKPYVALSHCWGIPSRHPLMTTHATLNDHATGIALSSLPQSFRDAIKVCAYMKIQYIWIDCLCIVQDDRYKIFYVS
jgi:heterokaryon incompatibility protein (HET)